MRLKQYINESVYQVGHKKYDSEDEGWLDWSVNEWPKMRDNIKKLCKPWLTAIKNCPHKALMRGVRNKDILKDLYFTKTVRQDRKPLDMRPAIQKVLDDGFERAFGWRPRSQGLFTVKWYSVASTYGTPYMIFPVGNFKFLWSEKIPDLYGGIAKYPQLMGFEEYPSNLEGRDEKQQEIWMKSYYTDKLKDLCKAMKEGGEIMIGCKHYAAVSSVVVRFMREPYSGYGGGVGKWKYFDGQPSSDDTQYDKFIRGEFF